MNLRNLIAGVVMAAAIVAPASAAIISVKDGADTVATVTCTAPGVSSPECQGVSGSPIGSLGAEAQAYAVSPSDPENEADFLNDLIGTMFTTGIRTDFGLADDTQDGEQDGDILEFTFTTTAEYFALKLGNSTTFFKNLAGLVTLTVFFDRADGRDGAGFGLSHITEFGGPSEIPLPAAAWLMLAGVAGLGFASRRKAA